MLFAEHDRPDVGVGVSVIPILEWPRAVLTIFKSTPAAIVNVAHQRRIGVAQIRKAAQVPPALHRDAARHRVSEELQSAENFYSRASEESREAASARGWRIAPDARAPVFGVVYGKGESTPSRRILLPQG